MTLVKKQTALAWELRGYLFSNREVILALRDDARVHRIRGYVVEVGATDAGASIDDARWDEPILVDLSAVLSVRRPHYHEDGPEPARNRPLLRPDRGPDPMPGQLLLGGTPPPVSERTRQAMERAAGMLLSQDLLDVLGALDRAARGKSFVTTTDVADALGGEGRGLQWAVRRLRRLADLRLAFVVHERPYGWIPGE